jgi:hypothetical protein
VTLGLDRSKKKRTNMNQQQTETDPLDSEQFDVEDAINQLYPHGMYVCTQISLSHEGEDTLTRIQHDPSPESSTTTLPLLQILLRQRLIQCTHQTLILKDELLQPTDQHPDCIQNIQQTIRVHLSILTTRFNTN